MMQKLLFVSNANKCWRKFYFPEDFKGTSQTKWFKISCWPLVNTTHIREYRTDVALYCIVLYWWVGHCCPMHCDPTDVKNSYKRKHDNIPDVLRWNTVQHQPVAISNSCGIRAFSYHQHHFCILKICIKWKILIILVSDYYKDMSEFYEMMFACNHQQSEFMQIK